MDAREALGVVASGKTLTRAEAESAMGSVMAGEATPAQLGALLAALHMRGETADEIAGFASVLRANALRVVVDDDAIDVVGHRWRSHRTASTSRRSARSSSRRGGRSCREAREPRGLEPVRQRRRPRGARREDRPRAGRRRRVRSRRSVSGSCSRRATTPRCGTPVRCAARSASAPSSTSSARSRIRPACGAICSACRARALGETVARALVELGVERALVVHGTDGLDEISPSADDTHLGGRADRCGARGLARAPDALGLKNAPRSRDPGRRRRDERRGRAQRARRRSRRCADGRAHERRRGVLGRGSRGQRARRRGRRHRARSTAAPRATALVRFAAKSQLIGAAETAAV